MENWNEGDTSAFHIVRGSPQTLERTDRALKKVSASMNKQDGVKFYWRKGHKGFIKNIIRIMRYARSSSTSAAGAEKGLKYGKR